MVADGARARRAKDHPDYPESSSIVSGEEHPRVGAVRAPRWSRWRVDSGYLVAENSRTAGAVDSLAVLPTGEDANMPLLQAMTERANPLFDREHIVDIS